MYFKLWDIYLIDYQDKAKTSYLESNILGWTFVKLGSKHATTSLIIITTKPINSCFFLGDWVAIRTITVRSFQSSYQQAPFHLPQILS